MWFVIILFLSKCFAFRGSLYIAKNSIVHAQLGDVIAYTSPFCQECTYEIGVISEPGRIQKLSRKCDFDSEQTITFHENEDDLIDVNGVKVLSVMHEAYVSQRICEDRISNPHGEHAENVYILDIKDLMLLASYKLA